MPGATSGVPGIKVSDYKGSALRAADADRYARTRKDTTKHEGGKTTESHDLVQLAI